MSIRKLIREEIRKTLMENVPYATLEQISDNNSTIPTNLGIIVFYEFVESGIIQYDEYNDENRKYKSYIASRLNEIAEKIYAKNNAFREKLNSWSLGKDFLKIYMYDWLKKYLETGKWYDEEKNI